MELLGKKLVLRVMKVESQKRDLIPMDSTEMEEEERGIQV